MDTCSAQSFTTVTSASYPSLTTVAVAIPSSSESLQLAACNFGYFFSAACHLRPVVFLAPFSFAGCHLWLVAFCSRGKGALRVPGKSRPAAICGHPLGISRLLLLFLGVVNGVKSLPAAAHDVVHHIITAGPPVSANFRQLDGEKLAAAQAEAFSLEWESISRRSSSP